MFKHGDKVKNANGSVFSNNERVVTVDRVNGDEVWFVETKTWSRASNLKLDDRTITQVVARLEAEIKEKQAALEVLKLYV